MVKKSTFDIYNTKWFTTKEIAEYLDVSRSHVLNLMKSGEIKSLKMGHIYKVTEDNFKTFLKNAETGQH